MLGLVSLFADLSTEMVYPLIPIYMTAVFGATPAIVGVVEGIAESTASLLKVVSGYLGDRFQRKKPIALIGYSTTLLYKLALILAVSWPGVLFARVIDRIGKGIRTAPRDALVAESSPDGALGSSFGLHKMLDMAGAALGILAAFFMMRQLENPSGIAAEAGTIRTCKIIFLGSAIPAVFALLMFFFIHEKKRPVKAEAKTPVSLIEGAKSLDKRLVLYLVVAFVFTLGNSSNSFLLLKAAKVGFSTSDVLLLYFLYNAVSSLLAIPAGAISDRIGRKSVLVAGYSIFALAYLLFALAPAKGWILAAFVIYGLYTAVTTGAERAFISEISPPDLKGTMLGLHSTIIGATLLPASVIAGLLMTKVNYSAPFILGSALSLLSAIILVFGLRKPQNITHI